MSAPIIVIFSATQLAVNGTQYGNVVDFVCNTNDIALRAAVQTALVGWEQNLRLQISTAKAQGSSETTVRFQEQLANAITEKDQAKADLVEHQRIVDDTLAQVRANVVFMAIPGIAEIVSSVAIYPAARRRLALEAQAEKLQAALEVTQLELTVIQQELAQ